MHSRIFEVVEIKDGQNYESRVYADDIYDWCQHEMFYDYIVDINVDAVADSIAWVQNCHPHLFIDDNMVITDDNAKEYFEPKYEKLIESVNNLSLAEFSSFDKEFKLYDIRESIDDKFGFHIAVQDSEYKGLAGVYSLDNFVRNYRGKFKIVNAFDYHF